MFDKVLIANRGEIALRVIRACKDLGIRTLAVYSEADADSLHVKLADEAMCIGAAASSESYLKIDRIISAAEVGDVDAIHPGYGFLAENAHFADICENCNIKFIGPTANAIRSMGDKAKARESARKAGVNVVPGSDGLVDNEQEALRVAKKLGYPVMIKAIAGGGGRGMRAAHNDVSLVKGFYSAKTEAERTFNNSAIYIEKFIENPHHIEMQILGDQQGRVVHLGERECSIQRRHQKLIEECPSPFVTPDLRKKMGKAALRLAESVEYSNAGTIEFLVDNRGNFYFLEMNTRIQVEHPVTEEVYDVDLVKLQIQIAGGERLPFSQGDLHARGAAIECRINAEDPDNNFMPSPGRLEGFYLPGGRGVRVDSHAFAGYSIPSHYDSLIAKVIVSGHDRGEALRRMSRALDECRIEGVKTTIRLQQAVLRDPNFRRGHYNLDFLDRLLGVKSEQTEE
ncbi:MAG: acetyl-CoA carboxylase biotin carboxylase subunit [Verrucomicrobia bacterium]|nr:acetyl-CoA carboxylase biotin carboxylase subunit [Verrucomicrobiota bacterium]